MTASTSRRGQGCGIIDSFLLSLRVRLWRVLGKAIERDQAAILRLSEQLVVVPLILVSGAIDYLASFRGNTFIVHNVTPI